VGAWAAGAVWRATTARRELAAAASYQGDTGELLFFYRRELENRLRSTQVALVLPLACALLIVRRLLHPFATINQTLGFAGLTAVLLASSAYVWFVRRPRLVRELAALKADLGKR
jgi:hypothetical protein